jgi:hypothetical protein
MTRNLGPSSPGGVGADQGAVLRLLGTIREEIEQIRAKQAEIYEVVLSYKDQIAKLEKTVGEKLEGLPKSPYIAGQLVPMPRKRDGVDDFRDLLATYLHPAPPGQEEAEKPVDVDLTPEPLPPAESEVLEGEEDEDEGEDEERPRRPRPERSVDEDTRGLQRGPERDVEPFDLTEKGGEEGEEPEGDERGGDDRGDDRRRGGRRRRRRRGGRDREGRGEGRSEGRGEGRSEGRGEGRGPDPGRERGGPDSPFARAASPPPRSEAPPEPPPPPPPPPPATT